MVQSKKLLFVQIQELFIKMCDADRNVLIDRRNKKQKNPSSQKIKTT